MAYQLDKAKVGTQREICSSTGWVIKDLSFHLKKLNKEQRVNPKEVDFFKNKEQKSVEQKQCTTKKINKGSYLF